MRLALIQLTEERYHMIWTSIIFCWMAGRAYTNGGVLKRLRIIAAGKEVQVREPDRYEDYIRYTERTDKEDEEGYWRAYLREWSRVHYFLL